MASENCDKTAFSSGNTPKNHFDGQTHQIYGKLSIVKYTVAGDQADSEKIAGEIKGIN
ncbi:hypothetical protein [Paenibacillus bovis]|uniref:hypothetical protein n=1 Tax=Paenibacillus bovis TaxID=1616788 RepID=UPI00131501A4|nr:hypothetical protein [Paenibacillus bovis]